MQIVESRCVECGAVRNGKYVQMEVSAQGIWRLSRDLCPDKPLYEICKKSEISASSSEAIAKEAVSYNLTNLFSILRPSQFRKVLSPNSSIPIMVQRQVQMWAGRIAGAANIPNKLSLGDSFPTCYC